MCDGRGKHLDDIEYDERVGKIGGEHDGVIGDNQQQRVDGDKSCYVMYKDAFYKAPAANVINCTSTSQKKSDETIIEEGSHTISRADEQAPYRKQDKDRQKCCASEESTNKEINMNHHLFE
ncbi:hypothetical protein LPW40_08510 [Salinicoccus halitifaciens]|uniref:Uncharacterized protein n=1 Tax=Salinicoccus halitifaciens TaxID=1073415 RepID=A0ABV2E957_9STAP|nr:hypothetical protein [Salinicoccus halitifaciens]MCD2138061.1 hypothetical protein [Salinicoccus halitifaciens]